MVHVLKAWDVFMADIASGKKTFEVRRNDRNYEHGDILILQGFDMESKKYTGKSIEAEITYMLIGGIFGIDTDYCVMSIKVRNYNF